MASELPATTEILLPTDASKQILDTFLGQGWDTWGAGLGGSQASELMLQIFSAFNLVALAVISALFLWVMALAVAGTAHEGVPFGKRFSSLWMPLRFVGAMGALAPIFKGLSLFQVAILACIGFSINLGNFVWELGTDYFVEHAGQITVQAPDQNVTHYAAITNGALESLTLQYYLNERRGMNIPPGGEWNYKSNWLRSGGEYQFLFNGNAGSIQVSCVDESDALCRGKVNAVGTAISALSSVAQQLADPEVNVLTGERFDADQRETDLDISSLFSVDTDMLKDAFQFDASKLQFDLSGAFDLQDDSFDVSSILDPSAFQLDLSDLDLSDIDMSDVELPDMDALDLSQLFADMDLSVSEDALQSLMKKIMNGYKRYIISNGILNLDKIGFSSYMESDQFKQLLSESMGDLLDTTGLQEQFTASLQQNLQGIMTSYLQSYSEQLSQKLGEALQTKLTAAIQTQMSTVMQQLMTQLTTQFSQQIQSAIQNNIAQLSSQVEGALKIDPTVFQSAVQVNMSTDDLVDLVKMNLQSSTTSYGSVLGALGYSDYAKPGSIWIYPKSFEAKNRIVDSLNAYNAAMRAQGEEDKVIVFSDTVGTLMSAVTKIVDMVSNVLVAFVAISLVVSSIMIGVITYISVLERRKEIGILRAIGASKHNVSEVFNAETFIIGMCSGVIGVGLCLLLLIPGNMLIHSIAGTTSVTAVLPPKAALVLIVLATLLTILGGLIPARSAAKCNPVTALRSE